jgi:hypothetical protein
MPSFNSSVDYVPCIGCMMQFLCLLFIHLLIPAAYEVTNNQASCS